MSGVAFPGDDWLVRLRELGAELPEVEGATARIQHHVTGAPAGDVAFVTEIVDGRVVAARPGSDEDAEVVLTAPHDLAVLIASGELDPSVAFMQGRLKMAGDMGRLLSVLPLARRPEHRRVLQALAESTGP